MVHALRKGSHVWLAGLVGTLVLSVTSFATAQDSFGATGTRSRTGGFVPSLSEATAILESAVREMYQNIEPGDNPSPNELIAYADLRALRLYTGALEVAGWDLEQASNDYRNLDASGFRGRRWDVAPTDQRVLAARDKYLAFRETVRTLLYRVRSTAVAVEHQVSFCDPRVSREWRSQVVPALLDVINATQPLFETRESAGGYANGNGPRNNGPRVYTTGTIPQDAVEVSRNAVYRPFNGQGRGEGRYFEVRAFGGPIRVKRIRYVSHENNFGVISTSVQRELNVNQIASPSEPLYVPCNRERYVDLSQLEVEWESADPRRTAHGIIDVLNDIPNNVRDN